MSDRKRIPYRGANEREGFATESARHVRGAAGRPVGAEGQKGTIVGDEIREIVGPRPQRALWASVRLE